MHRALADSIQHLCTGENCFTQPLPGLAVFSCNTGHKRWPMVYEPRICLIAQGRKRVYLGTRCYEYDANSYLINPLTLPVEAEIELPSAEQPFLGLSLEIDRTMVRQIISEMGSFSPTQQANGNQNAVQASPITERLLDAVTRLLQSTDDPLEQAILVPSIWREIYFEVLRGPHGILLLNSVEADIEASRMAPVIHYINAKFDQKLDIKTLAEVAHMSPSNLHEHFKQMTTLSPMQYIKNLRLHRAHSKILGGQAINQACYEVGYHSPSQFSREFKRFFGVSPREAAQAGYAETAYLQ